MTRILVVDDDSEIREMLRQMLEQAGYDVVDAPNGREAIRLYRREPTDLIITDIVMPEQDGIEAIIDLRHDFPDIKIIAISGGGRIGPEDYLKTAKMLGAHSTISKPFNRREMLEVVEELVGEA